MPTEEQIEAAARRMWRDEHGYITSHDSVRTPESDEAEMDRTGYGMWDGSRISSVVKEAFRRRAEAALRAAEEVGPWEYEVRDAYGRWASNIPDNDPAWFDPEDWPDGFRLWRHRPAGEWEEV